jgi:hypothetical protein
VLPDRKRNGFPDDAFGFAVPPVLANVYYEHANASQGLKAMKSRPYWLALSPMK